MNSSALERYSLGLDIGITSVGWAVLNLTVGKIADLGVRLFDKAEEPKTGASLAAPRREARNMRRRLRRKRQRMSNIRSLIISCGILSQTDMDNLFNSPHQCTPWELRTEGLDRLLTCEEWSRILIHMAKHRGFKSNRTVAESDIKNSEDGRVLSGIKENSELLQAGNNGAGYRTVGELIQSDPKFSGHKRNKGGEYSHTILRKDIEKEIEALFEEQRKFGSTYASMELEKEYKDIFGRQLPFASDGAIEKLIGYCFLEPAEKRAPKASWTAERFILLSKIMNLRVRLDGKKVSLSGDERITIDNLAYKNTKVTYKQIRKALNWQDNLIFDSLPFTKKDKDPEDSVFIELKGWHTFRKCLSEKLGTDYWETISVNPGLLDDLAYTLTFKKTDEDIARYLEERNIDKKIIDAVLPLNFSGVVNLSAAAMGKLIPLMEKDGCRYDEACVKAGYLHYKPAEKERSLKLPVPDWKEIRNPAVIRAIAETRKVVNAVVRKYGPPESVQVELARDLSRSKEERDKIIKEQEENRSQKEKLAKEFQDKFDYAPNGRQLEKFRLWKEQNGFCLYTGQYLAPEDVFNGSDDSFAEIDHIIPYSISFDDSRINKVLATSGANRDKGNRLPYYYFGGDGEKWNEFTARVNANIQNRKKAARLKIKSLDESDISEMKERNLSDTRYITEYVAKWLEENLLFAEKKTENHVTRINGRATATLRWQWGINALKDRESSDLHHALDACVVAAATPGIIKKISDYSRNRELQKLKINAEGNKKRRCPEPWEHFRKEVEARLSENPAEKILEFGLASYSESELNDLKPIFVSRRPDRGATGAAHKDTIYSAKYLNDDPPKIVVKKALTSLKKSDLENIVGKERDRALYEALAKKLEEYEDNPEKAFKDVFRKPTSNGKPGPIVHSVKIFDSRVTGLPVNGGIAFNDGMVRIDLYQKNGKYFLIPYYISDIAKKIVKDKAIAQGKREDDWIAIDETYNFVFSLFKNDLVRIIDSKGREIFGYYNSCDRATGAIEIKKHDGSASWRGIGIRTAKLIEKYQADVLGSYYKIKKEKPPHGLA